MENIMQFVDLFWRSRIQTIKGLDIRESIAFLIIMYIRVTDIQCCEMRCVDDAPSV